MNSMESNNLHLSVIIPTYNRAGMICRAIDSGIPQLTVDDEIIVIDDGSTDVPSEKQCQVHACFELRPMHYHLLLSDQGVSRFR
jgi:cellulose synthase/poly-beta-1,6-N-acetylglucosamine synthase-like glycosyltransferase